MDQQDKTWLWIYKDSTSELQATGTDFPAKLEAVIDGLQIQMANEA